MCCVHSDNMDNCMVTAVERLIGIMNSIYLVLFHFTLLFNSSTMYQKWKTGTIYKNVGEILINV